MSTRDRHWRQPFQLAHGALFGCSYDYPERAARLLTDEPADLALILFDHDDPGFGRWEGSRATVCHRLYWPTLDTPPDVELFLTLLTELHSRAGEGAFVEVFCFGGHGRTGTVLASAAVLGGESAPDAIARVRAEYCGRSVSTPQLERVVALVERRARSTAQTSQLNGAVS